MDITNYMNNQQNAISGTKSLANQRSSGSSTKDAYEMGMQQFLALMMAQLKNQDMMNPTSDTEFVSQMAQFTSLQAVANLEESVSQLQATYTASYATSLMGQTVVVASVGADGKIVTTEGKVTGVTLFEGQPIIYIGDKGYSLSQIMVVGDAGEANKPKPPTPPATEGGDGEQTPPPTPGGGGDGQTPPPTPGGGGDEQTPPPTGGGGDGK